MKVCSYRMITDRFRSDFNKFRGNLKIFCVHTGMELAAAVKFGGTGELLR